MNSVTDSQYPFERAPDEPDPEKPDALDALIRGHLEGLAASVDAGPLAEELVNSRIDSEAASRPVPQPRRSRPSSRGWIRRLIWSVTAAAALLVAFTLGRSLTPATASAATVLRNVQDAHSQRVDRCYHVQFAPDPDYWNGKNMLTGPSETVLWTRGDRFWAEATVGTIQMTFGRDEQEKLWVSPDRSRGIRLLPEDGRDHLPEDIATYCAINSMTVPTLVEHVLSDFDLRADAPTSRRLVGDEALADAGPGNSIVWASLKPGRSHPLISSALLEVNPQGTLERLVLWTMDEGRPRGVATFTLVETAQIGDESYRLSGHLDDGAQVRDHQLKQQDAEAASERNDNE